MSNDNDNRGVCLLDLLILLLLFLFTMSVLTFVGTVSLWFISIIITNCFF